MFFEAVEVYGHWYGLHVNFIKNAIANEKILIVDVDIAGAEQIYKSGMACNFMFVKVPSVEVLEQRLKDQHFHDEDTIKKRVAKYPDEVKRAEDLEMCYMIMNDDKTKFLEEALHHVNHQYCFSTEPHTHTLKH